MTEVRDELKSASPFRAPSEAVPVYVTHDVFQRLRTFADAERLTPHALALHLLDEALDFLGVNAPAPLTPADDPLCPEEHRMQSGPGIQSSRP